MAKQTTSFRLKDESFRKLTELAALFRESSAEVVERAVDYLYENREERAKKDLEDRLKLLNEDKQE